MSDFGDLRQYLDRDLTLTIDGKAYTIPAPNAEKGLELKAKAISGRMTDMEETVAGVELMGGKWNDDKGTWVKPKGSVFAKLMAEQDWDAVYRTAKTALLFFTVSRELAVDFWQTGSVFTPADPPKLATQETTTS